MERDAILILRDQTFKPIHIPFDVVGVAVLDGLFQAGNEGLAVVHGELGWRSCRIVAF